MNFGSLEKVPTSATNTHYQKGELESHTTPREHAMARTHNSRDKGSRPSDIRGQGVCGDVLAIDQQPIPHWDGIPHLTQNLCGIPGGCSPCQQSHVAPRGHIGVQECVIHARPPTRTCALSRSPSLEDRNVPSPFFRVPARVQSVLERNERE